MTEEEARHRSVILYISPGNLSEGSKWWSTLKKLAMRGRISFFCIDEAHYIEQAGRSFRTEFTDAVRGICKLVDMMETLCPRIAISATYRHHDESQVTDLLGDMEPNVMEGPLERQSTRISFVVSGDPAKTLRCNAEMDLSNRPDSQQIWYGGSRTNAEGPPSTPPRKYWRRIGRVVAPILLPTHSLAQMAS